MLPLIGVVVVLFFLLGMPASLLLVWGAGEQFTCKSCASTLLRSQWQATALPNIPPADRFYFDDNCEKNEEVHEVECPSSMCMEMLLVAGGEYTIVRGCLSDFYQGYTLPINSAKCYYAEYSQNITMINNKEPAVIQRPLVGTRYCIESNCNNDLVASYDLAINRKSWQGKKFCDTTSQMQVFQCLNCNRFDYKGDCDWDYRQYCDGEWCTKTMGYVNGRWVETRGCAPINPSGNQLCVKLDSTHEISQLSNQHVNLEYSIEQCFCQGQHCNAAIGRGATGGLVLVLAITLICGVVRIWAEEKFW